MAGFVVRVGVEVSGCAEEELRRLTAAYYRVRSDWRGGRDADAVGRGSWDGGFVATVRVDTLGIHHLVVELESSDDGGGGRNGRRLSVCGIDVRVFRSKNPAHWLRSRPPSLLSSYSWRSSSACTGRGRRNSPYRGVLHMLGGECSERSEAQRRGYSLWGDGVCVNGYMSDIFRHSPFFSNTSTLASGLHRSANHDDGDAGLLGGGREGGRGREGHRERGSGPSSYAGLSS